MMTSGLEMADYHRNKSNKASERMQELVSGKIHSMLWREMG